MDRAVSVLLQWSYEGATITLRAAHEWDVPRVTL